ncbi:MAG: protein NO VEIN domain-containing protein, partial [Armatimonadota bacterium]
RELRDRFRQRFDIVRGVDLKYAYGINPWQDKPQVITSMDFAKREDVLESLRRTTWDLIIVDEAHRMSASDPEHKTERYRLGELLSQRTHHFLPHPEREQFASMVRDEEVERIAMEEAMRYERQRGWEPEDVSAEDRGFDILSRHPETGSVRFIEVKGRAGVGPVALTPNEYKTAERLRGDYWLYV